MTECFLRKHAICIYLLFTFHFRAFYAMLVACLVRCGSRRFFRVTDFLPRLELFSVDILFLKMPHISFFLPIFLSFEIHVATRARVCVRAVLISAAAAAQNGKTALILAATYGHADCARLLLDAGADKDAKCNVRARAGRGGTWGSDGHGLVCDVEA